MSLISEGGSDYGRLALIEFARGYSPHLSPSEHAVTSRPLVLAQLVSKGDLVNVVGGYVLAPGFAVPVGFGDRELLPCVIVTVSDCLVDVFPQTWALRWVKTSLEERTLRARSVGVPECLLEEVLDWTTAAHDREQVGWPTTFSSLDTARDFCKRFPECRVGKRLLGVALPEEFVDTFLRVGQAAPNVATPGIYAAVQKRQRMDAAGCPLGFELLGYEEDAGSVHSWHCNLLAGTVFAALGIRPNKYGLIDGSEDAARAAALAGDDRTGAEPAVWMPWAISEFGLDAP